MLYRHVEPGRAVNGGRGTYRSALAHRDLRRLLAALLISYTGSWSYTIALAVFAYAQTHSAGWVAAVSLGRFIPALIFSAYGGVVAERFERVRLMVATDLASVALQLILALIAASDGSVLLAVLVASLSSVLSTVYPPAVAAMIPQIVGEDDLAAANALQSTVDNLVVVLGPAVGALFLIAGSPSLVFVINAGTFVASAVIVASIRVRSRPTDVTEGGHAGPFKQMQVGLSAILHSSTVALLVSFSVAASFIYGTDTVLFAPISRSLVGSGVHGYGYLLAGCGLGSLVAAWLVNRIAASPRLGAWIVSGLVVYCLPTSVLLIAHRPTAAFALEVIRGSGTVIVDVLAVTALQRAVSSDLIARVFGVFFALVLAAISLGALITPFLLSLFGLRAVLLIFGVGASVVAVVTYPWVRRIESAGIPRARELEPVISLLQAANVFSAAPRVVLERLAKASEGQLVEAGTIIVREGDPADAFFILKEGQVEVSARAEAGRERRIRGLSKGDYFGEIGLLGQISRTATVRAATSCSLLRIPGDEFIAALTEAPPTPLLLQGARTRLSETHPSERLHLDAAE